MKAWALIDCNNFFVSCERVFRPDLWQKPVLVLSCNDGCVVSRSQEVKDLGIAMGVPRFQIEEQINRHKIACFSSNFRLYADLSSRVMAIVRQMADERVEIYSIDECFCLLEGMDKRELATWGMKLRQSVQQQIGIPVTVGIAQTKTLAKVASDIGKKDVFGEGVVVIGDTLQDRVQFVDNFPVQQVWGIGRASARKLLVQRINTVRQLVNKPVAWVRQIMGLAGEKTWRELWGEDCIALTEAEISHRRVSRSRSFGEPVSTLAELRPAIAEYLTVATDNLNRHHWRASLVTVYARTSRFVEAPWRYVGVETVGLEQASGFLPTLMTAANQALERLYRPGFRYKKAGVILGGLESAQAWQPSIWGEKVTSDDKKQRLMRSINQINGRYGDHKVQIGAVLGSNNADVKPKWRSRKTACSPEYSTKWDDLRQVK